MAKKEIEHICNNCRLYDRKKGQCKVAILINGEQFHMPVFPGDRCHMEELGIEVEQVRWYVEDSEGNPSAKGKVKVEFPDGFFGEKP
jgi:hypothetical protein